MVSFKESWRAIIKGDRKRLQWAEGCGDISSFSEVLMLKMIMHLCMKKASYECLHSEGGIAGVIFDRCTVMCCIA